MDGSWFRGHVGRTILAVVSTVVIILIVIGVLFALISGGG